MQRDEVEEEENNSNFHAFDDESESEKNNNRSCHNFNKRMPPILVFGSQGVFRRERKTSKQYKFNLMRNLPIFTRMECKIF